MKDVHSDQVADAASWFCSNYAQVLLPGPVNVTQEYFHYDSGEDSFQLQILSIANCQIEAWENYKLYEPLIGVFCEDIIDYAWKNYKYIVTP